MITQVNPAGIIDELDAAGIRNPVLLVLELEAM
jgi:hypothetical protein